MARFFVTSEEMQSDFLVLTGENARHAKVLRLKCGEAVLVCDGEEPGDIDFTQAARIAALYSSASDGQNVAVDYTKVRHLKKTPGAKPGFVIYHTNWTAYVTPDADEAERLRSAK